MPEDNVVRVKNELYQQAKDIAEAEGISMSDAVTKLVKTGGLQPSSCELTQFRRVLESQGLTPPKHPDWIWGLTDVLPPDILAGSKLEPYAEARREAELRCGLGNELFGRLIEEKGSVEAVEETVTKPVAEPTEQSEPVAELEATEASEGESIKPEATASEGETTEPPEAIEPDQTGENL